MKKMKVREFAESFGMKVLAGGEALDREISGVYIGDLLSWVMSHVKKEDAWITVHTHMNIVAVAVLTEASCIIVPEGISVEETTLKKASEEGIPILGSDMTSYEIAREAGKMI